MGTIIEYQECLFPPCQTDGRADTTKAPTEVEVLVTDYYGDHQVILRSTDPDGSKSELHLTKVQAGELGQALQSARSRIGYDNTAA